MLKALMIEDEAVKKLRNKIWVILAMSFTGLLVLILAVIYLLMSVNTQALIYQTVNTRAATSEYSFEDIFFTVTLRETAIDEIYASSHVSPEKVEVLVSQAVALFRDHYYYQLTDNQQVWAYMVIANDVSASHNENNAYSQLIFVNVTDLTSKLDRLLFLLVVIGGIGVLMIWISHIFISNQLMKPTKRAFEKEKNINARQSRFIANASHELRTPLTLIKGSYDEVTSCLQETVENQKKLFDIMDFGIKRMMHLTDELLTLAECDHGSYQIVKDDMVDIDKLIHDLVKVLNIRAMAKEVRIVIGKPVGTTLKQNEEKLRQVMLILLDNAIKYVNCQGWIQVEASLFDKQFKFVVINSGEGISSDYLPHIFERFYRGDERLGKSKGYGLGLAIAKEIIALLGGHIYAESTVDKETIFGFTLPDE